MKKHMLYFLLSVILLTLTITACSTLGFGDFENTKNASKATSDKGYTFTHKDDTAKSVSVAGDFNDWDANADLMTKKDGTWTITKQLTEGKHQYKFVINGSDWITDESNPNKADDGYGGSNSEITIGKIAVKSEKKEIKSEKGEIKVKFSYQPLIGGKHDIFVAGDFNNWDANANPMKENNGIYEVTLNLSKGKHTYKFVVDGNWITDENAEDFVDDGLGGQNAVIYVGGKDKAAALRKVEFAYKTDKPIKEVYLVGAMNDWNQKKDMLNKID